MKRRMLKAGVLAGYAFIMSVGLLPALVSLIVQLRGVSAVQGLQVLSAWVGHRGYLPWKAMAIVAHHPDAHLGLWLAIVIITSVMGLRGACCWR